MWYFFSAWLPSLSMTVSRPVTSFLSSQEWKCCVALENWDFSSPHSSNITWFWIDCKKKKEEPWSLYVLMSACMHTYFRYLSWLFVICCAKEQTLAMGHCSLSWESQHGGVSEPCLWVCCLLSALSWPPCWSSLWFNFWVSKAKRWSCLTDRLGDTVSTSLIT